MGEIGKLQYYRTLRFWGGGSAYVVWEGGGWSGVEEVNDSGADLYLSPISGLCLPAGP